MAQLEKRGAKEQPIFPQIGEETVVRGYHQYCSFGKNAKTQKTYYDLANEGDWKYLMWCEKVCSSKKKSGWFTIDESCHPHITTALRSKENPGTWTKQERESVAPGIYEVWYETDTGIIGPVILYQKCKACGHKKNQTTIQRGICDKCAKK
jgi:hypothetical protein